MRLVIFQIINIDDISQTHESLKSCVIVGHVRLVLDNSSLSNLVDDADHVDHVDFVDRATIMNLAVVGEALRDG